MTKLQFPTMAEKTLAEFNAATKTVALQHLARKAGAFVERGFNRLEYVFDDDSRLVITGRGKSYKATPELP